ncbi:hypothetical protein PInf_017036 [Phytophthora infestans]|nr:hypothetical protein PInf_017036 [Phytophthora infestans]
MGLLADAAMTATTAARGGADFGQSTKHRAQQRQHKRANVLVTMQSTGNELFSKIKGQKFSSRGHRVSALQDGLENLAKESQRGVHELLGKVSASFARSESFWITNQVYVQQATPDLIKQLEKVPGVQSVEFEKIFPSSLPVLSTPSMSSSTSAAQWGVSKINAPDVWATGNTGQGVVIGSIDTGHVSVHVVPYEPSGTSKDCSKAPNIVNNSWGGGQGLTMFDGVINAWRAAGIIPVVAAGNTGPNCGTIASPGDSASVITVGATDINDGLASFSSKGPTVRGLRKPDVAAPGALVLSSCWTDDASYCFKSGSSMAAPHVAGAIALYLSANPGTSYDKIKDVLQSRSVTTTLTTPTGYACGKTQDRNFPNNQYGYGRVDIFKALS